MRMRLLLLPAVVAAEGLRPPGGAALEGRLHGYKNFGNSYSDANGRTDAPYVFSTVLLVVWLLWTRDGLPSSARDGLPTATGFRRRASDDGRHKNYLVFGWEGLGLSCLC